MDTLLYAGMRQRELLDEADRMRLARILAIARCCGAVPCPDDADVAPAPRGLVDRLAGALPRRRSENAAC